MHFKSKKIFFAFLNSPILERLSPQCKDNLSWRKWSAAKTARADVFKDAIRPSPLLMHLDWNLVKPYSSHCHSIKSEKAFFFLKMLHAIPILPNRRARKSPKVSSKSYAREYRLYSLFTLALMWNLSFYNFLFYACVFCVQKKKIRYISTFMHCKIQREIVNLATQIFPGRNNPGPNVIKKFVRKLRIFGIS